MGVKINFRDLVSETKEVFEKMSFSVGNESARHDIMLSALRLGDFNFLKVVCNPEWPIVVKGYGNSYVASLLWELIVNQPQDCNPGTVKFIFENYKISPENTVDPESGDTLFADALLYSSLDVIEYLISISDHITLSCNDESPYGRVMNNMKADKTRIPRYFDALYEAGLRPDDYDLQEAEDYYGTKSDAACWVREHLNS